MKSLTDCYKLANGVEIPCIGFGTWQTPDGDVCVSSVKAAIAAGYRHIDTAEMYGDGAAETLICEALGPVAQEFIKLKRMEWLEYMRHVSDWELKSYLEFF